MILSDRIEVGQITFIIRVVVQLLGYAGVVLLGMILLGNAPRVGNADTHDVVNRVVGASTHTKEAFKWILLRLRNKRTDPSPSKNIMLVLFLYISYSIFVSLSDIGFLGFYSCSVPGSNFLAKPASVNTSNDATNLISRYLISETDPSKLPLHRCSSVEPFQVNSNITLSRCTSWENSTYGDQSFFNKLNSSDSEVLMPRFLSVRNHSRQAVFDLVNSYVGPNTQRITTTTLQNAIAVDPQESHMTAVFGIPGLVPDTQVGLETLAVELDVGCMTVGIYAQVELASGIDAIDVFRTNGTWRQYTGPEYMRDVLTKYADQIRDYSLQFFNGSTPTSNGYLFGNKTNIILSPAANVGEWSLQAREFLGSTPQNSILGNCTADLKGKLGIVTPYIENPLQQGTMCNLLGVGGSINVQGIAATGFSRMICASATQVNLVNTKVSMKTDSSLMMDVSRIPSDLHYTKADYWDLNGDNLTLFPPIERFTLSPNPNSPTSHYIAHRYNMGPGMTFSGGGPGRLITTLGYTVLGDWGAGFDLEYASVRLLGQGFNYVNFTETSKIGTRWISQVGASYMLTSLGYNGWAALDSQAFEVVSTGGHAGTCYKPPYAIGFLPLVVAATVVIIWACFMMFSSSLFGSKAMERRYGGLAPYLEAIYPNDSPKDVILAWESTPKPHLQVVSEGTPIMGSSSGDAVRFLKSAETYSP